jgi:3-oxoacyl-[acyl-carrier protein] reductase
MSLDVIPSALVTGSSRGIGAAIALELAKRGYFIYLNYQKNAEQAESIRRQIEENKGQAQLIGFDVSDPNQVEKAFLEIHSHGRPLEILVNNAGICRDNLLLRASQEDLDATLDINLKGAIFCSKAAAKLMLRQRKGSIILISSVIGEMGNAGQSVYAASKAGLIGFSKSIARELASRQIRVNVIAPGFIQTDMTVNLTDPQRQQILETIPLGFLGSPQDVAGAVGFLSSPESRFITGQVIGVNGGQYI